MPYLKKNIFNRKNLNYLLSRIEKNSVPDLKDRQDVINDWINYIQSGNIDFTKETALQGKFLDDIFSKALGYKSRIKNTEQWNLNQEQLTTIDSKFADGSLGFFSKSKEDVKVVIELKGSNISLDEKQHRHNDTRTPIEQAFSYQHKIGSKCKWIIVSNYKEIRLYHHSSSTEFEVFNITELGNWEQFRRFYFLLSVDNLISSTGESIIDTLYAKNEVEEVNISKQFYLDFKQIRTKLFEHLKQNNPDKPELLLLEKTQKFLDRFIFLSFCEDNRLLPEKTFKHIIETGTRSYAFSETKIWNELKGLFQAINVGSPPHNINKFNGGLFATDSELDELIIKDSILEEIAKLTEYDFETDVDVNILGHIFEQSISDIEEIKSGIEGKGFDKKTSKRKKDGIYYTPEYITKYIVENAVGGWLDDRKKELGYYELPEISNEDFQEVKNVKGKIQLNEKLQKHLEFWLAYKVKLMEIKVLDPACGSGAFLNQAFNFLYAEGQTVNDRIAEFSGGQTELFGLDKHILSNNLFGVDLNNESVEITKLSLWIKTANAHAELTALDNNIKCGNSLIDDPAVAGDKAFNWSIELPEIMQNVCFDVVIGNPPYVYLPPNSTNEYLLVQGNNNTYIAFVEKSLNLLNNQGIIGFIIPNTWFSGDNYNNFRNCILKNNQLKQIIQLPYDIFEAYIDTSIVLISKTKTNESVKTYKFDIRSPKGYIDIDSFQNFNIEEWLIYGKIFLNSDLLRIGRKVWFSDKNILLGRIASVNRGSLPPQNFELSTHKNEYFNIKWFNDQVFRYEISKESLNEVFVNYESLRENKPIALFQKPKILARQLMSRQFRMNLTFTDFEFAFKKNLYAIYDLKPEYDYKYLLSILNSKLFSFCQVNFNTSLQRDDFPAFSLQDFKSFPIPNISLEDQQLFINLAITMLQENKEHQNIKNEFQTFIKNKFVIEKATTKLQNWYELEYNEFLKELTKAKVNLPLEEQLSWQALFTKQKALAQELRTKIDETDKKIDAMVYELYGLTEEEIKIVEGK